MVGYLTDETFRVKTFFTRKDANHSYRPLSIADATRDGSCAIETYSYGANHLHTDQQAIDALPNNSAFKKHLPKKSWDNFPYPKVIKQANSITSRPLHAEQKNNIQNDGNK